MQLSNHQKSWGVLSAGQGFLAVAAGAFGAHGLKDLVEAQNLAWWETACQYMMYHSLAGLIVVLLLGINDRFVWSARLFTLGNFFFSGSLFVMTLTDLTMLGMITPIGGLLYLAGWVWLIRMFVKNEKRSGF